MKQYILLLLVALAMTACQPTKNAVRTTGVVGANGIIGNTAVTTCTNGQSTMGAIIDPSNPTGFQNQVYAFLSASVPRNEVGTVSSSLGSADNTGIRFTGLIRLDASGNVVSAASNLNISVYDSIWAQDYVIDKNAQPIPLEFSASKGATFSGLFSTTTGAGYFLVKDSYGEVRFDGTYNAQTFSGTVSFRNTTNVNGGAGATGTLGQFTINSCGIIQK